MGARETSWPDAPPTPGEGDDSIAARIASRIHEVPALPGDALDWAAIAAAYEHEAAGLGGEPGAAALVHEAGRIYEERLGDAAAALACYRRALAIDPAFLPNVEAARRLATQAGDDALAVDLLATEIAATSHSRAGASLMVLRARLLERLGRTAEARAELDRAAALDPSSFAAAEARAVAAAAAGDPAVLAEALLASAAAAGPSQLAAQILCAASAVLEGRFGDDARAYEAALRAFALDPGDAVVRATARRAAERAGRVDDLAAVLRAEASARAGRDAAEPLHALAELEGRRGDQRACLEALERARAAAPDDTLILADLVRLREAHGEWAEASAALEALAQAHLARPDPDVGEAVSARLRRAEIEEERLGRTAEAALALRAVAALDPANRAVLAALGRLCARSGDHAGLAAAFLAEAAVAGTPRDRADRLVRAAEILEERLGDLDGAVRAYEDAIGAEPALVAARAALERLYERTGRFAALAALLADGVEARASPAERVALLLRIARLREDRLGDVAGAIEACRAAVAAVPDDREALRSLGGLLSRAQRWEEAVAVRDREALLAEDPGRKVALLQVVAEILEDRISDPERARAAWERVREADPHHSAAARALGRYHARAGRWEEVAALHRVEAGAAASPEAAADHLVRLAEILESRLGRGDEALAALREALALAPTWRPALDGLVRLCRVRNDHQGLAEALRTLAAARREPAEQGAALVAAGRIWEEALGNAERAVECYQEALRAVPGFAPALNALERVHSATGRIDDLARIRRAAAEARAGPDAVSALIALATLEADQRGDAAAAVRVLDQAERVAPSHPGAALLRLRLSASDPGARGEARRALAGGAPPAASAALLAASAADLRSGEDLERAAALAPEDASLAPAAEHLLRVSGDAVRLAELCETRRLAAGQAASRAHWALRAGEAWERASEVDKALAAFQAALADAPASLPALRGARSLFARRGDWAAVRASLQAEGAALRDPASAARAWLEAGVIAEERFADPESAVHDYRMAMQRDPRDPVPLARLEALLGEGAAGSLAEIRVAQARAETDPARAAEAWLVAARVLRDAGAPAGPVLEALDRALEARRDLAPALELRARVRAAEGRRDAVDDYQACIAQGGEPAAVAQLHSAAAELLHARGERALAASHLQAALALQPERAEALERLARVHAEAGSWPAAAEALRRLVALPAPGPDALAARLLALAKAELELGDPAAALARCRAALEVSPGDAEALAALARLQRASVRPEELAGAWELAAQGAVDPVIRADAHARAAAILAGPVREPGRAARHLRAALEADPSRDDVRASLATACEEQDPGLALESHRVLLERNPLRVDSWAALFRIFDRVNAHDRAHVAASVLRWLGAPPEGASALRLRAEADRQVLGPPPPLDPSGWAMLRHPADAGPLAEVIAAAGDAFARAVGDGGGVRREPLPPDHPLRRIFEELARSLGIDRWELCGSAAPGRVEVDLSDPPAVVVGEDLPRRTAIREQRFLLGRAAARLRAGSAIGTVLAAPALAEAVAAAVRQVVPGYTGLGVPSEDLARRIGRALSRRARKALEPAARSLVLEAVPPSVEVWAAAAAATADRAGLVLCGDVPAALASMLRNLAGRTLVGPAAVDAARARPDVRALLSFSASEAHFALRQRMRVAIE